MKALVQLRLGACMLLFMTCSARTEPIVVFRDGFESGGCTAPLMCNQATIRDTSYWQAAEGSNSLEIIGGPEPTINGLIQGYRHRVSFDFAANPFGPEKQGFVIFLEALRIVQRFEVDRANSPDDMRWTRIEYEFSVPTYPFGDPTYPFSERFYFTNNNCCANGPVIDNFTVTALVSEPTSLALAISGLFVAGTFQRRRLSLGRALL